MTGVGIGAKVVNGQPTGQVAVTVFVQEKLPAAELSAEEVIPADVDGVATDVVVLRDFQLVDEPLGAVYKDENVDEGRHRPIEGGIALKGAVNGAGAGSIGCILLHKEDPAKVYALTCHHVIAHVAEEKLDRFGLEVTGRKILAEPVKGVTKVGQPDLETRSTCCKGIFGTHADGEEVPEWDAAVVELDPGIEYRNDIRGLSVPGEDSVAVAGEAPMPTEAQLADHSYLVRKRGMRTGLTGGRIVAAHCDIVFARRADESPESPERFSAKDVVIVAPHPNPQVPAGEHPHFLLGGDSGSVTVDTANRVLGLNFMRCSGGSIRPPDPNLPVDTYFGVIFPLCTILKRFDDRGLKLKLGTAAQPGQTHTVPGRPTVASQIDEERITVVVPEPAEEVPAVTSAPANADQLAADLARSARGRELLDFWRAHSRELRRLVNSDRRVAAAWHRSGASAVYQVLLRGLETDTLRIPSTVDGKPLDVCLDKLLAALRLSASEELRADLDRMRELLPDLAGLTRSQIIAALSGVPATSRH
ncbi:hypothetical protein CKY47_31460 [Saccharothrix yanglingensis]|uniref:Trypsin-like peptidase n=1 Tax=Saccharothrix yanglingensis TaxID=659496 RepID=A0ABU0X8E4_9PSEU|nr:hypothetical protein [Saccharothrix yanglingensis]